MQNVYITSYIIYDEVAESEAGREFLVSDKPLDFKRVLQAALAKENINFDPEELEGLEPEVVNDKGELLLEFSLGNTNISYEVLIVPHVASVEDLESLLKGEAAPTPIQTEPKSCLECAALAAHSLVPKWADCKLGFRNTGEVTRSVALFNCPGPIKSEDLQTADHNFLIWDGLIPTMLKFLDIAKNIGELEMELAGSIETKLRYRAFSSDPDIAFSMTELRFLFEICTEVLENNETATMEEASDIEGFRYLIGNVLKKRDGECAHV